MTLRRRGLVAASAAALLALGLGACSGNGGGGGSGGGTPQYGGTLKLVGSGDVDHLDPTSAYYTSTDTLIRAYARQLVNYPASRDPKKAITPVPDVATELPTMQNGGISPDGKTYTFHLRSGVMWDTHPAREVTAQDFIRGFKRMCNPVQPVGAPSYYTSTILGMAEYCDAYAKAFDSKKNPHAEKPTAANMAAFQNSHDIAGLSAPDDKTLVIKLKQPASDFLNILAMRFASAAPKEYDQYVPDSADFRQHTISDGPYQITQYTAGKQIVLQKNPAWKQSSDPIRHQYVDQIQVVEGQDSADAVQQQMQEGAADLSWDLPVPTAQIPQLEASKDPNFSINPGYISNPYLVFNLQSPNEHGAMKNVKVRQAIEYAINKVAIGKVYGGPSLNTPIHSAIPPGNVGYQEFNLYPTPGDQGDPAKCRQLLAQAGYKNGLHLIAAYRNAGNHPAVAQSYAADLKNCGISVQLVPVRQGDYYGVFLNDPSIAKSGKWDITAPGWVPDWYGNNGRTVLQPLFSSNACPPAGVNYGCYQNPQVDDLMNKALASTDPNQAANYWHQADVQIMKDAAIVPFQTQKTPLYHSSRVHNAIYLPTTQQFDVTNLWLSK